MVHKSVKFSPTKIDSLNIENGTEVSDLELFFLVVQDLLQDKIESGKKGKKLKSGHKLSYEKAQGILFNLNSYFAIQGCFSFGICQTCEKFGNGISSTGMIGMCNGQEKNWCDTCSNHSKKGGGFGL